MALGKKKGFRGPEVPLAALPDLLQFPLKAGTSEQAFHAMTGAEPDQGESAPPAWGAALRHHVR